MIFQKSLIHKLSSLNKQKLPITKEQRIEILIMVIQQMKNFIHKERIKE